MLHILWTITKTILCGTAWVLLVILGIILIVLILVLFCPVRYQAGVCKQKDEPVKDTRADGRISWLFGGIAACFNISRAGRRIDIRLFGISLDKICGFFKKKKKQTRRNLKEKKQAEQISKEEKQAAQISVEEKQADQISEEEKQTDQISGEEKQADQIPGEEKQADQIPGEEKQADQIPEEEKQADQVSEGNKQAGQISKDRKTAVKNSKKQKPAKQNAPKHKKKESIFRRMKSSVSHLISSLRKKIQKTRKIIRRALETKDFVLHPKTRAAFRLVMKKAKSLLRHVWPTSMTGRAEFGFEDPSITGIILALLGSSFPFHKNRVEICPHFENENVLEGNIELRGRIYGIIVAAAAVRILLDKNVHFVIRRIKHKEAA